MPPRIDLYQNLVVHGVTRDQTDVRVEILDAMGENHWISFRFPDIDAATARAETLERWQDRSTTLTYVKTAGDGALVDDTELLRRAFEDDDHY